MKNLKLIVPFYLIVQYTIYDHVNAFSISPASRPTTTSTTGRNKCQRRRHDTLGVVLLAVKNNDHHDRYHYITRMHSTQKGKSHLELERRIDKDRQYGKNPTMSKSNNSDSNGSSNSNINRRNILKSMFVYSTATITSMVVTDKSASSNSNANAIQIPEQKSYSSNARNMERMNNGDTSGGSTYNNAPTTPVASKRRAMVGCKIPVSRIEASRMEEEVEGKKKKKLMNEKECNTRVMGGDTEFMLKALRNLDCPTCPYGIDGA